jgi:hypothetical protein
LDPFTITKNNYLAVIKQMSSVKAEIPAAASAQGTSYDQMRQMMSFMSGDNNRASTSASALESIKLLAQLDGLKMSPEMQSVYEYEKAYLEAGIKAVSTNPALGEKFGRGLEGATIVASFMKTINAEEQAKNLVRDYLPKTGQNRPEYIALHESAEAARVAGAARAARAREARDA